jgi:cell division protein YceG involved in septum cleavage
MTDADKILHALAEMQNDIKSLQEGQQEIQKTIEQQGNALADLQAGQTALQTDVKLLKEGQETLDLKVEAFHAEQTKANMQTLTMLTDMNEINAKTIDTRVTRIESTSISSR